MHHYEDIRALEPRTPFSLTGLRDYLAAGSYETLAGLLLEISRELYKRKEYPSIAGEVRHVAKELSAVTRPRRRTKA